MNPPLPIETVEERLNAARRRFIKSDLSDDTIQSLRRAAGEQFDEQLGMGHSIPGPSSVLKCRRQLWFASNEWDKTNEADLGNDISLARGIVMEPYWRMIFAEAGLPITTIRKPVTVTKGVIGSPDGYLDSLNPHALVEYKSLTGWRYHYLSRDGVSAQQPDYEAQSQLYMHGTGRKWCLLVAAPGDPQLYRWVINKRKNPDKDPKTMYAVWIKYDPAAVVKLLDRIQHIQELNASSEVAPADHNPEIDNFPCGYCDWKDACLTINRKGGYNS